MISYNYQNVTINNVIVYIEGIEIPVSAVRLNFSKNKTPTASLTVPLDDILLSVDAQTFLTRALVEVFVKWDGTFRLAFEGEIVGVGNSEAFTGGSMTLTCMGIDNYFDSLKLWHVHNSFVPAYAKMAGKDAYAVYSFANRVGKNVFVSGLKKAGMYGVMIELYGQIIKRIKDTTAVRYMKARKLQSKILIDYNRFVREKGKGGHLAKYLKNAIQGMGGRASLRQFLKPVMDLSYYEWVPIPFPPPYPHSGKGPFSYIKGWNFIGDRGNYNNEKNKHDLEYGDVGEFVGWTTANFVLKPQYFFAPPMASNIIFPFQVTQMSYNRNLLMEPTRILVNYGATLYGSGNTQNKFVVMPKVVERDIKELDNPLAGFWLKQITVEEEIKGVSAIEMSNVSMWGGKNVKSDKYWKTNGKALLYKAKYGRRKFTVTSVFDPYLSPGFPGAVISPNGLHLIGNIDSVSHSFNPMGAQSVIQFSEGRVYWESTMDPPDILDETFDETAIGQLHYSAIFMVDRIRMREDKNQTEPKVLGNEDRHQRNYDLTRKSVYMENLTDDVIRWMQGDYKDDDDREEGEKYLHSKAFKESLPGLAKSLHSKDKWSSVEFDTNNVDNFLTQVKDALNSGKKESRDELKQTLTDAYLVYLDSKDLLLHPEHSVLKVIPYVQKYVVDKLPESHPIKKIMEGKKEDDRIYILEDKQTTNVGKALRLLYYIYYTLPPSVRPRWAMVFKDRPMATIQDVMQLEYELALYHRNWRELPRKGWDYETFMKFMKNNRDCKMTFEEYVNKNFYPDKEEKELELETSYFWKKPEDKVEDS